jgi:hypothetical protein
VTALFSVWQSTKTIRSLTPCYAGRRDTVW